MRKAAIVCFRYTPEATNKKKCRKKPCEIQVKSVVSFLTLDKHTICIVMGKVTQTFKNQEHIQRIGKLIFVTLDSEKLMFWGELGPVLQFLYSIGKLYCILFNLFCY